MVKGKIAVLGERHFTTGFLFAGVQDIFTTNKEEMEAKLIELMNSKNYAIIFITETLNERLDWKLKKKIEMLAYPVIVPLPDMGSESSEGANIKALIKRALGFDLTVK